MPPSPPAPPSRPALAAALLVAALAGVLVLPALVTGVIATSDEARFPLLARDMMTRGTWFEARLRDEPYRNKPPLYPWAIVAVSRLTGGVTDASARAPVVLAAMATVFVSVVLGRRLFGARAGVWGGLVLATSWGFVRHGQLLLPDMIVVAFATAAACAFWRSVAAPPPPAALPLFYAACALAVFAKGPVGLLPVVAAAVWLVSESGVRGLRRLASPAGAVLFVAITLLWLAPFLRQGGGEGFGETVLWRDWMVWFVGLPRPVRILDFLGDVLRGLLPWALLLPALGAAVVAARRDPAVRFAAVFAGVPLVVLALSANLRERYSLPFYPSAALLVGWWLDRHAGVPTAGVRRTAWAGAAVAGAAAAAVVIPAARGVTGVAFLDGPAALVVAAALALVALAFALGLGRARPRRFVAGVAAGAAVALAAGGWAYGTWATREIDARGLAHMVERHARGTASGVFGGRYFEVDFYLGRPQIRLRTIEDLNEFMLPPARRLVLIDERGWRNVVDDVSPKIRVIETRLVGGRPMRLIGDR